MRLGHCGIRAWHRAKYKRALLLRRGEKLTGAEIARRLKLNKRTVCSWLREEKTVGIVRVRAYHVAKYRKALSLRRDSGGALSGAAIARRLRLLPRTVNYWLRKESLHAQRGE